MDLCYERMRPHSSVIGRLAVVDKILPQPEESDLQVFTRSAGINKSSLDRKNWHIGQGSSFRILLEVPSGGLR